MGLGEALKNRYREDGYTVAAGAVGRDWLGALTGEVEGWVEASRRHPKSFGETLTRSPRFEVEPGHCAASPRLRRVNNPADISEACRSFIRVGPIADLAAELVGPDVKFLSSRINLKLPGMAMAVAYHQDHPFQPHTNDDFVSALLMLDDADEENGCLRVIPGSHRERHSHHRGDAFAAAVADAPEEELHRRSVPVEAAAGDVCFVDSWLVHGSAVNRSKRPRRLFIVDLTAADAYPLNWTHNTPSVHTGEILRGQPSRVARLTPRTLEMPSEPGGVSIFRLQGPERVDG